MPSDNYSITGDARRTRMIAENLFASDDCYDEEED